MEITVDNGSEAYLTALDQLASHGAPSSPRGQATRELLDVTLTITDPAQVHVLGTTRNPSAAIAATEAAHLIAGVSSLEQLDLASGGRFSQFADYGRLRGAYGPRVYRQMPAVVRKLAVDSATRQAVVTIWRGDELEASSRDVPCTLSLQFTIRDGRLNLRTVMRSEDVWLGLPYDLEVFGALHQTAASALSTPAGMYTHTTGSLHLYDRDSGKASAVLEGNLRPALRKPVLPDGATPGITVLSPVNRWLTASSLVLQVVFRDPAVPGNLPRPAWYDELTRLVPALPPGEWRECDWCRYITSSRCPECPAEPPLSYERSALC